jgi:hypothetical protein
VSYLHIENLYRNQDILLFKWCFAMEKIHGTSQHISWNQGKLGLFAGGNSHPEFVNMFDLEKLTAKFEEIGREKIIVFGEGYGGKCQGMSKTYGKTPRFVAFEIKIDECWLSVPDAEEIVQFLELDFVPYEKCSTDIETLNTMRDKPSDQATKCGILEPRKREGIVLRPLIEVTKNNGARIIAKHKAEDFSEVKTPREVNPDKLAVLSEASAIADEWVTEMRLTHILQSFPEAQIEQTKEVIRAMIEDVERESEGEIVPSKEARTAIGKKTAAMFLKRLKEKL